MTNAFSKLADPYDQPVADMLFTDWDIFAEENMHIHYYYIDGELITVAPDGDIAQFELINENDATISVFNHLIKMMQRRFHWYYGKEYTTEDVMRHIKKNKRDKEQTLRDIYEETGYADIRTAECPFRCEGCMTMRICQFCGGQVSICKATINQGNLGLEYFCDNDCFSTKYREKYTNEINMCIGPLSWKLKNCEKNISKIEQALKVKGKTIHLPTMTINGKDKFLRTELEKLLEIQKVEYECFRTEMGLLFAILKRDKKMFHPLFQSLQEKFDMLMQCSRDDEQLLNVAEVSKKKVQRIHLFAEVFLGIMIED